MRRFILWGDSDGDICSREDAKGEWARYEDAQKLEEALREAKAALELLRAEMIDSGNANAKDFGWQKASASTEAALARINALLQP